MGMVILVQKSVGYILWGGGGGKGLWFVTYF